MGVDGQLCVVQPQLLRAYLINFISQPQNLRSGEKAIPTGNDQMYAAGQTSCQGAEKMGNTIVRQQMEIVDKNVAGAFTGQLAAEIIRQQPAAAASAGQS